MILSAKMIGFSGLTKVNNDFDPYLYIPPFDIFSIDFLKIN